MSDYAADLQRLAETLRAGGPVQEPADRDLLASLAEQAAASLDPRPALVREMAARFFPGQPALRQADEIAKIWSLYACSAWARGECEMPECPPRHAGRIHSFIWRAMRHSPRALGVHRIRQILGS